jgi:hypothetical protein
MVGPERTIDLQVLIATVLGRSFLILVRRLTTSIRAHNHDARGLWLQELMD